MYEGVPTAPTRRFPVMSGAEAVSPLVRCGAALSFARPQSRRYVSPKRPTITF
jgi:hypothetical protein